MRKSLSVAVCAVMLACTGVAQASVVSTAQAVRSDVVTARGQQASNLIGDNAKDGLKTRVVFDTRTSRADASVDSPTEEKESSALLLVAGLLIMGVIIRRRSGRFD